MSRLPEYQLAWSLNQHLKVDFRKLPELMVYHPKKAESLPHTLYSWTSPNAIDYFLITSLEKTSALSSETFLLIEKRERRETVEQFIEKIAASDFIFSVEEITPSKHRQLTEQLNNIAIDMEERLDALKKEPKYYLKNVLPFETAKIQAF
jgi:hypothetical protein